MVYQGVSVALPPEITEQEAILYLDQQYGGLKQELGEIAHIEIRLDGDEVSLKGFSKDPIRRIRRITGYLSEETNFNHAKQCELHDRVVHAHM